MPAYRHILIPTDFSPAAECALQTAAELARQNAAELHLLHIVAPQLYYTEMPDIMLPSMEDLTEQMIQSAEQRLQKAVGQLGSDIPVHHHVREAFTRSADAIVEVAKELAIELIVIGSHGHSGLMHVLLGSTAERVVREAACDVLVVKKKNSA
ncbi:MAG: universal stress protein [Zetaproteobacteria bacterium CG12_big_fil_rev_8_21_14_0_65_55_1124]|nr:MAG: hypothetical protein AUJ58_01065 [Zetaproteobacteria bacterium CG1_02_55_237]PIS18775.1 MAG: universal stress protein [Zetaproteobacteria bacterium CG08_land_8_20_14_0_20_55_17]PIW43892.1 MAG: universal stress protein [Zetaproteobacteria bacterium CG12_big_fil_rev_8_21_14_0_65_55_1124]PIY54456.1 MAG: universal stress protein [Zetaproteobacteria bacterium CG_4_10_14_0_8_um_filter_55_43]PIZ38210.1 MAG: universal stress protein [Zetaproteobacteria bacterium CG_4_10_14_0_2_um_filter_55_20]